MHVDCWSFWVDAWPTLTLYHWLHSRPPAIHTSHSFTGTGIACLVHLMPPVSRVTLVNPAPHEPLSPPLITPARHLSPITPACYVPPSPPLLTYPGNPCHPCHPPRHPTYVSRILLLTRQLRGSGCCLLQPRLRRGHKPPLRTELWRWVRTTDGRSDARVKDVAK